jgi:hypothetical protein
MSVSGVVGSQTIAAHGIPADLVTAEPEVNIGSSRRDSIMTFSETPSKEQHENGTTYQTPQLGPAP